MSTFHFSLSKIFPHLLVPIKFSIFIFGPSFKVKLYLKFIFFNKIFQKNSKYYKNDFQKNLEFFLKYLTHFYTISLKNAKIKLEIGTLKEKVNKKNKIIESRVRKIGPYIR